jgi:prevent-host-death family protein
MQASIAEAKKHLCKLLNRAQKGETITILRHGKPSARLVPIPCTGKPWRVSFPDDPKDYADIDIDKPIFGETEI